MKKLLLNIVLVFLLVQTTFAQTPDLYPPKDPEPIDFSLLNIILYIVMPLVLIVVFLLYRRKKRKEAREKKKNR
jgi:uncharacterized BrkB/YihY/UPF0761 family membrane protein